MARGARSEEIPSGDDPVWHLWADAVLEALSTPRNLEQLKNWAREEEFEVGKLVNSLAWLDLRGLVETEQVNGLVVWKRTVPKAKPVPKPLPSSCARCFGRMHVEPERVVCLSCGHSVYPPVELE